MLLSVARVGAGWLIVPLYAASLCTNYLFVYTVSPWSRNPLLDNIQGWMFDLGFGAFATVGALLVARRPTNAIGWIMATIGLMVPVFNIGSSYANYVMATQGGPGGLAVFGAWVSNWYWFLMLALALIYLPMLFPDGRLLSRRWLSVATIGGIGTVGAVALFALADPVNVGETPTYQIDNPVGIETLGAAQELPIFIVMEVLFALGVGGATASVVFACAARAASSDASSSGSPTSPFCFSAAPCSPGLSRT